MSFSDKFKDLSKKAQEAAAEHQDQIREAVAKAESTVDQRTGGQYREQIARAGEKANALVDSIASREGEDREKDPGKPAPPAQ